VKVLVDMNLSPEWLAVLAAAGFAAVHWQSVGSPAAPDEDLFGWAEKNRHVLLTQDLDFSQLLFRTRGGSPSVVLVRLRNELDAASQTRVCRLMRRAAGD
jgi:predicted nuclease of predicted toxin-antitoxin system